MKAGEVHGHRLREVSCSRAERVAVYARGRLCAEESCETVLSAYNPSRFCVLHERKGEPDRPRCRDKPRDADRPLFQRACAHRSCGQQFESRNASRLYCSDRCRMAAFQARKNSVAVSAG